MKKNINGLLIFEYGNGQKVSIEKIRSDMNDRINYIKLVDRKDHIQTKVQDAIEIFIGYAKRKDTSIEEVEMVYKLMREVFELYYEIIDYDQKRLDYIEDLKVLIKDKNAIVSTFISTEELQDAFKYYVENHIMLINIENLNVTLISLIEGRDKIRDKYQDIFNGEKHINYEILPHYFIESECYLKRKYPTQFKDITINIGTEYTHHIHQRRLRLSEISEVVVEEPDDGDIIEEAMKIWMPSYFKKEFKVGAGVVIFPTVHFLELIVVFVNCVPYPRRLKIEDKKDLYELKEILEDRKMYVMIAENDVYREVHQDI